MEPRTSAARTGYWNGREPPAVCQFAARNIRQVLRRSDGFFVFLHGHGEIRGGKCRWFQVNGHERITPFQSIDRHATYSSKRRQSGIRVIAFVDPDPAFIHSRSTKGLLREFHRWG